MLKIYHRQPFQIKIRQTKNCKIRHNRELMFRIQNGLLDQRQRVTNELND